MKTFRRSLRIFLFVCFVSFAVPSSGATSATKMMLILGDSLTAGYGLDDPATEAFPARLQQLLNKAGASWRVVGAGLSGDTTAGGLRRVDWALRQPVDLFVLALGGNDGLRGLSPAATRANLDGILAKVRAKYPAAKLVVAGMQMPPNLGADYLDAYRAVFPAAAQAAGATLIPFLLEGVGGVPELNQPDGIHPTAKGHARVAETLWRELRAWL
ncbi:MAG: arylesterase [Opitutae bacterium]|nr:arylesterase [Opitutae bacterium]